KFTRESVADLDALYQLPATGHAAQIQLLDDQIRMLERARYPYLVPSADGQRLLWIPGRGPVTAFTL
ncbi:MAG: hypothetical protein ACREMB_19800, partial [Candidatus Rokuibacteriota bacterium]